MGALPETTFAQARDPMENPLQLSDLMTNCPKSDRSASETGGLSVSHEKRNGYKEHVFLLFFGIPPKLMERTQCKIRSSG